MQPAYSRRIGSILSLPRSAKKTLAVLTDSSLCVLTVWLAICFRFESWISLSGYQWLAVIVSILLAIPLLSAFGFYHTVIRYVGRQTIVSALRAIGVYAIIYSAIFTAFGFEAVPRTIGVLQPVLLLFGLALVRILASQLLSEQVTASGSNAERPSVLIYGAGNSGQQLASSLTASGQTHIVGFLDDNENLHNAKISGIPVYSPQHSDKIIQEFKVRDVLLALPSIDRSRRNEILKQLKRSQVGVRTLPSLTELAQGKVSQSALRELDIDDLLGRDPVKPIPKLLAKTTTDKVVLVTGAGGSIGSELCRQLLFLAPKQLVLLDSSEYALYQITSQLNEFAAKIGQETAPVITSVLANVRDEQMIHQVIAQHQPDTIYHAAAYKHVPLVEANPSEGLQNNILGTYHVARAAMHAGVKDMVLISTDKAVRPTNVMGASKRLAELCLHCLANAQDSHSTTTRFCIVRFGNVLDSSGSVVPKFRQQIRAGGPITLTHPEITRYFMTIPEAAQLVIQASGLHANQSDACKVYLLDMGDSVKIIDLAKVMIQLNGMTLRDASNPDGDIAIELTGLRPGEKLYEELLVSGDAQPTQHPKIMAAEKEHDQYTDQLLKQILSFSKSRAESTEISHILRSFKIGYSKHSTD
jgi:FlaA1/EpsC-like NDP-sugar epimerase